MKVFKFGGASLKDAAGVRNVAAIIQSESRQNLLVVVSAMGKTTDQLEDLVVTNDPAKVQNQLLALRSYHETIARDLMNDPEEVLDSLNNHFEALERDLTAPGEPDYHYDQIVSYGELVSSTIVHHYLKSLNIPCYWLDARRYISTDNHYREAAVDWEETRRRIGGLRTLLSSKVVITQGFIGSTHEGFTTTLGREGSDFSAAIFGSSLHATSVTIWKDVAGVMSADPKRSPNATVFAELPFREAAEMTYYGASVIHPKTIKPLANLDIPLLVKNFDNPKLPGTRIHACTVHNLPPLVVFKDNQCLISCKVTDFTFISEQQLSLIFTALSELGIRINVMQNSAISFSFCIDFREHKVTRLIARLQQHFEVNYNTRLTLITVKNYDPSTSETYRRLPGVVLEQSSRSTLQVLVKDYDPSTARQNDSSNYQKGSILRGKVRS